MNESENTLTEDKLPQVADDLGVSPNTAHECLFGEPMSVVEGAVHILDEYEAGLRRTLGWVGMQKVINRRKRLREYCRERRLGGYSVTPRYAVDDVVFLDSIPCVIKSVSKTYNGVPLYQVRPREEPEGGPLALIMEGELDG